MGKEKEIEHILNFFATAENVCQIGTSLGTSRIFPNSGSLFGPGGNGISVPLRRQFQIKVRTAIAPNAVA